MANPRREALLALIRVERDGAYLNIVLDEAAKNIPNERDRALLWGLARGVTERKITLDSILKPLVNRPLNKLDKEVLTILRLGAYQLRFMDTIPVSAAVNESVKLCREVKKTSAKGFVNGVLRNLSRSPELELSDWERLSVPKSLYEAILAELGGERANSFLEDSLLPPPLFLRVNSLKNSTDKLIERLVSENVSVEQVEGIEGALKVKGAHAVTSLQSFKEGLYHVQDISSQLAAMAVEASPGMDVLDCCSAPGGKAFTMAGLMGNRGQITALDLYPERVKLIENGAGRLGASIIKPLPLDARALPDGFKNRFDRVLCDVVCSGLGIIRRKPEIKYKNLSEALALPEIQLDILNSAAGCLKSGGRLVYSTCTLRESENMGVVRAFLAGNSEFSLVSGGLINEGSRTLVPDLGYEGDGFFIAVLGKRVVE